MKRSISWSMLLALLSTFCTSQASAEFISLDSTSMGAMGVTTFFKGQLLEDELNLRIFHPRGMELELAAPTGGTIAVDDFAFEGPGLTVIGGSGFILRWQTTSVESVRIGFSNFKDDGSRSLFAFDSLVDYTRDPSQTSQSSQGNVIANPDTTLAVDSATGIVPSNGDLSLTVTAPSISSIWVRTNFFLTSWTEVEFETVSESSTVPEPSGMALFVLGLSVLGLRFLVRKTA